MKNNKNTDNLLAELDEISLCKNLFVIESPLKIKCQNQYLETASK